MTSDKYDEMARGVMFNEPNLHADARLLVVASALRAAVREALEEAVQDLERLLRMGHGGGFGHAALVVRALMPGEKP